MSGVARCTVGDVTVTALAGDSVDVPVGVKHRPENTGPEPLVIVEVQRGDYTGEDDIRRYEDDYGRCAQAV
jgi:mannose-6-phosphate isomerase-like protein (cupin superfamily)